MGIFDWAAARREQDRIAADRAAQATSSWLPSGHRCSPACTDAPGPVRLGRAADVVPPGTVTQAPQRCRLCTAVMPFGQAHVCSRDRSDYLRAAPLLLPTVGGGRAA